MRGCSSGVARVGKNAASPVARLGHATGPWLFPLQVLLPSSHRPSLQAGVDCIQVHASRGGRQVTIAVPPGGGPCEATQRQLHPRLQQPQKQGHAQLRPHRCRRRCKRPLPLRRRPRRHRTHRRRPAGLHAAGRCMQGWRAWECCWGAMVARRAGRVACGKTSLTCLSHPPWCRSSQSRRHPRRHPWRSAQGGAPSRRHRPGPAAGGARTTYR